MKITNLTIRDLFADDVKLTFLVGAGCSTDPPSCLPLGREMIEALIDHSCAESEQEKLHGIKNLRFEQVVEIIRSSLDPHLKLMDYYDQSASPNMQHFFLAEMMKKGHFVMTTNFDFLLEHALVHSGVPKDAIIPVITRYDFEIYSDPNKLLKERKIPVYKIHGSTKNIITRENTRDSLKVTIQAFGSGKEGESVFQVEPFKRPLFEHISKNRTLVIMGYSGSDDFDIVPTLMLLEDLQDIFWIHHMPDEEGSEKIYKITGEIIDKTNRLDKVDKFLADIFRMKNARHIYRVDANTSRLLGALIEQKPTIDTSSFIIDLKTWLKIVVPLPDEFLKSYIPFLIYEEFSMIDSAMNCAKKLLEIAEQKSNDKLKGTALNSIGYSFLMKDRLDDALKYFRKALKITEKIGDLPVKALRLNNVGHMFQKKGQLDEALKYYQEALAIGKKIGNFVGRATLLNNIGSLLQYKNEVDDALKYYQEALAIDEKLGDLRGKARVLNNTGILLKDKGEVDEALKYYKEALTISKQLGDIKAVAPKLTNIGQVYKDRGQLDEALNHFQEALTIDEKLGDLRGKTERLSNIGKIFEKKGQLDKALIYYQEALTINEEINDLLGKAWNLRDIGPIHHKKGNNQKALEIFEEALMIVTKLEILPDKAHILWWIGVIHDELNDQSAALNSLEHSIALYKELGQDDKVEKVQKSLHSLHT